MTESHPRSNQGVDLAMRKFVAPEVVFGAGARKLAARYERFQKLIGFKYYAARPGANVQR